MALLRDVPYEVLTSANIEGFLKAASAVIAPGGRAVRAVFTRRIGHVEICNPGGPGNGDGGGRFAFHIEMAH